MYDFGVKLKKGDLIRNKYPRKHWRKAIVIKLHEATGQVGVYVNHPKHGTYYATWWISDAEVIGESR